MASMTTKRAALAALEDRFGRVTAADLVDASRSPNHPLHAEFHWDDDDYCAYQHRLEIARSIIASVKVTIVRERVEFSTVAYVRDPDLAAHEQGFIAVAKVIGEAEASEAILLREVSRVVELYERARSIALALDLDRELNAALSASLNLKDRIRSKAKEREPA